MCPRPLALTLKRQARTQHLRITPRDLQHHLRSHWSPACSVSRGPMCCYTAEFAVADQQVVPAQSCQ